MVPLDARRTVLDWMSALKVPLLLVAGSYLGSISHTLTCLDVLRRHELSVRAVVVNETSGSTVSVVDAIDSMSRLVQPTPVLALSRSGGDDAGSQIARIAELL